MNISIIGLGKIGYYYDHKINGNIQTLSKAFIKSKIFNLGMRNRSKIKI